jgi:hypothetical protein
MPSAWPMRNRLSCRPARPCRRPTFRIGQGASAARPRRLQLRVRPAWAAPPLAWAQVWALAWPGRPPAAKPRAPLAGRVTELAKLPSMLPHRAVQAQDAMIALSSVAASVVAASGPRAAKPQIAPDSTDSKHFAFYPISTKPRAVRMCQAHWISARFSNPQFSWL